jgi:hypothetical protein
MSRGQVGDHVRRQLPGCELAEDIGRVAEDPDRCSLVRTPGGFAGGQGGVEVGEGRRQVSTPQAALELRRVDLDYQADSAQHPDRDRLGAAHPAEPGTEHQPACQ